VGFLGISDYDNPPSIFCGDGDERFGIVIVNTTNFI
jgi:hypothetical protein